MAFIATVVKVINQYKDPVLQCVTMVGDVLRSIVEQAANEKVCGFHSHIMLSSIGSRPLVTLIAQF